MLALLFCMSSSAQTAKLFEKENILYERKNQKPFTGTREELLILEKEKLPQPKDTNITILVADNTEYCMYIPLARAVFVKENGQWKKVIQHQGDVLDDYLQIIDASTKGRIVTVYMKDKSNDTFFTKVRY